MNPGAACDVARAQLSESVGRLFLVAAKLRDAEAIERLTLALDRMVYQADVDASTHND